MYSGTLIDELMATVERAEKHARIASDSQEAKLAYWYVGNSTANASSSIRSYLGWHNGNSS